MERGKLSRITLVFPQPARSGRAGGKKGVGTCVAPFAFEKRNEKIHQPRDARILCHGQAQSRYHRPSNRI